MMRSRSGQQDSKQPLAKPQSWSGIKLGKVYSFKPALAIVHHSIDTGSEEHFEPRCLNLKNILDFSIFLDIA